MSRSNAAVFGFVPGVAFSLGSAVNRTAFNSRLSNLIRWEFKRVSLVTLAVVKEKYCDSKHDY